MKSLPFLSLVGSLCVALAGVAVAKEDMQKLLTEAQTAYMRGDIETAKTNFEMVRALDPRNQTAAAFLQRIKVEQAQKGGAGEEKKYAGVVLPSIEFKEATLRESLEFLRKKVNEMPNNKAPVNFVLQLSEEQAAAARVTLNLKNIPFTEALRYLGDLTGVTFVYDKYAIVVKPASFGTVGGTTAPAK